MVLIPPDIGLRLRLQNELLPQPVTPLQEIPAELPELRAGQTFTARIQEVLPENTYRALVAGKSVTLALPEAVKSGDMLELVVVDRTAKSIIAQLAPQAAASAESVASAYPHASFSRAAQLIGGLLPAEGESPAAAPLNRGQPLLAQPPQGSADLAPALGKAVSQSGLFYESHQAQWVAGKLTLADLLKEPQGTHSSPEAKIAAQADKLLFAAAAATKPETPAQPAAAVSPATAGVPSTPLELAEVPGQAPQPAEGPPASGKPPASAITPDLPTSSQPLPGPDLPVVKAEVAAWVKEMALPGPETPTPGQLAMIARENAETRPQQPTPQTNPTMTAASIPDELRPLVQQQLDAAGTQRLIWHGEVWPGQTMHWEIDWQEQASGNSEQNDGEAWGTTLRLSTPRLGEVEAALRLGPRGVRLALTAASGASAADLRAGAPELEQALGTAGIPLLGFTVRRAEGQNTPSSDNAHG